MITDFGFGFRLLMLLFQNVIKVVLRFLCFGLFARDYKLLDYGFSHTTADPFLVNC